MSTDTHTASLEVRLGIVDCGVASLHCGIACPTPISTWLILWLCHLQFYQLLTTVNILCVLRTVEHLGSGQFGIVNKGVWQCPRSQEEVAIKLLQPGAPEEGRVKLLKEAAIIGTVLSPQRHLSARSCDSRRASEPLSPSMLQLLPCYCTFIYAF